MTDSDYDYAYETRRSARQRRSGIASLGCVIVVGVLLWWWLG